jgi:hypothetical protein
MWTTNDIVSPNPTVSKAHLLLLQLFWIATAMAESNGRLKVRRKLTKIGIRRS